MSRANADVIIELCTEGAGALAAVIRGRQVGLDAAQAVEDRAPVLTPIEPRLGVVARG